MSQTLATFIAVFLAELGDKTQVATLLFAAGGGKNPLLVFFGASAALIASTAIAVLVGCYGGKLLDGVPLKPIAGVCFVALGLWMTLGHFAKA